MGVYFLMLSPVRMTSPHPASGGDLEVISMPDYPEAFPSFPTSESWAVEIGGSPTETDGLQSCRVDIMDLRSVPEECCRLARRS